MSFQPTIPLSGVAGWRFLDRTAAAQREAFEKGSEIQRDIQRFEAKIATVDSVEALMADRSLLKVALGAFGLEGDIDKRAFIRKVLEEGTTDGKDFANRLTDPSYRKLAETFGFGNPGGSRTKTEGFAAALVAAYKTRQFEVAVGSVNDDMRLALNFRREMPAVAAAGEAAWFQILGSKPLRQVMEKALGLPKEFVRIGIDQQREVLRDKARTLFGGDGIEALKDPKTVEKVIDRFLARSQMEAGLQGGATSPALQLLQNANSGGPSGIFNLLLSRG